MACWHSQGGHSGKTVFSAGSDMCATLQHGHDLNIGLNSSISCPIVCVPNTGIPKNTTKTKMGYLMYPIESYSLAKQLVLFSRERQ